MAKQSTRQVSIFLNGKEVENSIKAIAAEQKKANNELSRMIIGTDEYVAKADELKKINTILADHRKSLSGVDQGWSLAKVGLDKFVGVAAGAFTVDAIIGFGKQLFNTGVQLDSMGKKARTVFGEAMPLVTQEAENNARAMGLTNAQYIAAAANIQDLLVPMGFQRKTAAEISTQLLNLSGALSEWSGGTRTAAEVSEILNKALLGEREELKSLGISISEADVQAALLAKGLDKLTGSALEQAKATATLELIMSKSVDAQAQFAQGSGSLARTQAETTAKFQEIIERLSNALIPVFNKLVSVAGGVADAMSYIFDESVRMGNQQDSLVQKTQKLQAEFNSEIQVLTEGNFTQEERSKLISEINQRYGEYLPNLISEKATIDQIRVAQENANKVFAQKILFLAFEEKLTAATKAAADASNLAFNSEKRRQELLQKNDFQDNSGLEESTRRQIEFAKTLRETSLQTVKDTPKQIEEIKKVYGALAEELGTTLDDLNKRFGAVADGGDGKPGISKEQEKQLKELNDLIERTTQARLDFIAKATDDEVTIAIRGVEKRYDAEIAKARELEKKGFEEATAQRLALEKLKADEISLITDEYYAKEFEKFQQNEKAKQEAELKAYEETLKFLDEKRDERAEKEIEIKEFERAGLLTDRENELLELEEHYKKLLDYATKNGIDTVALTASFEAQKTEISKKGSKDREEFERQLLDNYAALQIERANAVAQGAAILGQFFEDSSEVGKAFFLVEKAAAAVSVLLSLQKEKAAIFAAARLGTLFDPTGAAALALATPQVISAQIRAGISLATIAASAIKPFVKQRFMGGAVIGETDGRTYYPSIIGTPNTGLLPGHSPVMFRSNVTGAPILANERGREYFVSHRDLQNPAVANYVQMIDSIVNSGARVRQFADGGSNVATSATPTAIQETPLMREMAATLVLTNQLLTYLIQNGVMATIPDGTVIGINDRLKTLQKISGGYF